MSAYRNLNRAITPENSDGRSLHEAAQPGGHRIISQSGGGLALRLLGTIRSLVSLLVKGINCDLKKINKTFTETEMSLDIGIKDQTDRHRGTQETR